MPPVYSGALQPKKKHELQEIAAALGLIDSGSKDEVQNRIKKYLDANASELQDDPKFGGLLGRRKRSLAPQSNPAPPATLLPSSRFAPSADASDIKQSASKASLVTRHVATIEPIREQTPQKDMRDVSMFLKNPISPIFTPTHSPGQQPMTSTPSSLPPLPPSPDRSMIEHFTRPPDVGQIVQTFRQHEHAAVRGGSDMFVQFRTFISDSRNIWSLTAVFELLYILSAIIPWQSVQIPLSTKDAGTSLTFVYPPLATVQSTAFWTVLLHWFIPTLVIPAIFGTIVSFHPIHTPTSRSDDPSSPAPIAPFDPLTASIIRLAAQIAYPFPPLRVIEGVPFDADVLGSKWRTLTAGVGVAFAFAEAIAGAPQVVAKAIAAQAQVEDSAGSRSSSSRDIVPAGRRVLTTEDTVVAIEDRDE